MKEVRINLVSCAKVKTDRTYYGTKAILTQQPQQDLGRDTTIQQIVIPITLPISEQPEFPRHPLEPDGACRGIQPESPG